MSAALRWGQRVKYVEPWKGSRAHEPAHEKARWHLRHVSVRALASTARALVRTGRYRRRGTGARGAATRARVRAGHGRHPGTARGRPARGETGRSARGGGGSAAGRRAGRASRLDACPSLPGIGPRPTRPRASGAPDSGNRPPDQHQRDNLGTSCPPLCTRDVDR